VTDNIFDRLRDLLQSSGPVNWRLAAEIAASIAGAPEPIEPWVAEEFEELTHTAAIRVAAASPLEAAPGPANSVDRRTWAADNVENFSYLAEPLAAKISAGPQLTDDPALQPLGPALLGMQMGSMAGAMSQRVLGQSDVGLPVLGGQVCYVVPNVDAFASDHGLDIRQTRLWLALHEVAHHAELSVPWMTGHIESLVADYVDSLRLDPEGFGERLEALQDPSELQQLLEDPGALSGLIVSDLSDAILARLQALMAVMEGYAEWLVDRAAPGLIPDAPRLREAIDRRRAEPSPGEQMLQRMLGLDLEHHRYRLGTTFCNEVADRWGEDALSRLWDDSDALPSAEELEDALGWAARVLI
jgi:putative hydrolase